MHLPHWLATVAPQIEPLTFVVQSLLTQQLPGTHESPVPAAQQMSDVLAQRPERFEHPAETQRACWGLDQTAIARRLARRWQLPSWLTAVVGHLSLPVEIAQELGAEPELFRLVQLAVGLAKGTLVIALGLSQRFVDPYIKANLPIKTL